MFSKLKKCFAKINEDMSIHIKHHIRYKNAMKFPDLHILETFQPIEIQPIQNNWTVCHVLLYL